MPSTSVLVYDDHGEIASALANRVRRAYPNASVTAASGESFQELLELINHRRSTWREDGDLTETSKLASIDKIDVVVVDYDLLGYSPGGDTTGSRLAYLLRCFSTCGFIVVLNEYGVNAFDYSLGGPWSDFADLHIGDIQIGNAGLWSPDFKGYRPWHWPIVPSARSNFEKCVKDVQANFDEPVFGFLGLESYIDWLPRHAHDFFYGSGSLESVRFSTFVEKARGGIEPKDSIPPEHAARVAAARLIAFLNLIVLPEQSIIVDAPHLVSRFPSLIGDAGHDLQSWNRLCDPVSSVVDDLLPGYLEQHRFQHQHWLWKPGWYWPEINKDTRISEVTDPWSATDLEWVFCENVSRFLPTRFGHAFRADVSPPFTRRYVVTTRSSGLEHYLEEVGSGGAQDPLVVDYIPQAAFIS